MNVPPHGKGPANHGGGVFVNDQLVFIVLTFAIAVRGVRGKKLPAFHFGVPRGFDLVAQILLPPQISGFSNFYEKHFLQATP
jgi:hypothetical protein